MKAGIKYAMSKITLQHTTIGAFHKISSANRRLGKEIGISLRSNWKFCLAVYILVCSISYFCSAQSTYLSIGINGGISSAKGYKADACFGFNLGAGFNIGKISIGLENGISNINYFREVDKTDALGNILPNKVNVSNSFTYYNISLPISVNVYNGFSLFGKPSYNLAIGAKNSVSDGPNYRSYSIPKENNVSIEGGVKYSLGSKNKVDLGLSYLRQVNASLYPNASCFLLSVGYRINSK